MYVGDAREAGYQLLVPDAIAGTLCQPQEMH